jgi:hypothetical protein
MAGVTNLPVLANAPTLVVQQKKEMLEVRPDPVASRPSVPLATADRTAVACASPFVPRSVPMRWPGSCGSISCH